MGRIADIGKIVKQADCDNLQECEDGSYSTSSGRGACAGHGGVKGSKKRAVGAKKAAPGPRTVKNQTGKAKEIVFDLNQKQFDFIKRYGKFYDIQFVTRTPQFGDNKGIPFYYISFFPKGNFPKSLGFEIRYSAKDSKSIFASGATIFSSADAAYLEEKWGKFPYKITSASGGESLIDYANTIRRKALGKGNKRIADAFNLSALARMTNAKEMFSRLSFIASYLAKDSHEIGAIYKNPPTGLELFECRDGTYSTSPNCSWHKGPKTGIPVEFTISRKGGKSQQQKFAEKAANMLDAGVTLIPIGVIKENRAWFQNRASAFSDRSVNNIVNAAKTGKFLWVNFDPITVWPGPAGKLYVLSGHSRLESFKRLCKLGVLADGRDFCHIPAKVAKGLSKEEARKVALESNTLSTKETDLERAQFYANMRAKGATKGEIQEKAKQLEGQNASKIVAFSYLNPGGKTMNALVLLDKGDQTSKSNMENIGRWIGNARKRFSQLTNLHEDELFVWLVNNKGYGTSKGQISNEREFKSRLESIINRRTEFGQLMERLNIASSVSKSPAEREYDAQMAELRSRLAKLKNQIKAKTVDLARKGAKDARIINIIQPLQARQTRLEAELKRLTLKKSDVLDAAKNEITLF